jgi:hypothetical protein
MQPRRLEGTKTIFGMSHEKHSSCLRVFVVLSLLLVGDWASAQTPAPPNDGKREFTVSGCLLRNGYAGYQVDTARVEAIDGKAVAAPSAAATAATPEMPKKWILDGGGNLGTSTGKKVEVIGRSDWQPPSATTPDEPPNRTPHLDVKSVKTIASTCS